MGMLRLWIMGIVMVMGAVDHGFASDSDDWIHIGPLKKTTLFQQIITEKNPQKIPSLFDQITRKSHGKGDSKNPQKRDFLEELYKRPKLQHNIVRKAEEFKDRFSLPKLGQILFALSVINLHPSDDFLTCFQTKFLNVLNSGWNRLSFKEFSYRLHELSRFHIQLNPTLKEFIIRGFHGYLDANPSHPQDMQAISRCLYNFALLKEIPPEDLAQKAARIFCYYFESKTKKTHDLAMFHLFKEWYGIHVPGFFIPDCWNDLKNVYLRDKKEKVQEQTKNMSRAQQRVLGLIQDGYTKNFPSIRNEEFIDFIGNCVDLYSNVFGYLGAGFLDKYSYHLKANVVIEVDSFYHYFLNMPDKKLPKDVLRDWILEKNGYIIERLMVHRGDSDDDLRAKLNSTIHGIQGKIQYALAARL